MYQRKCSFRNLNLKDASQYRDAIQRWIAFLAWLYGRSSPKEVKATLRVYPETKECFYAFSLNINFRADSTGMSRIRKFCRESIIRQKSMGDAYQNQVASRVCASGTAKQLKKEIVRMMDSFSDEELAFICQTPFSDLNSSVYYTLDTPCVHFDNPLQQEMDTREVWEVFKAMFFVTEGLWD